MSMQVAIRWVLVMGGGATLMACPRPAPHDSARARRARPVPKAETAVAVEGFLRAPPKLHRLELLPPYPRFRDPFPLPRRSLRRERRLAYRKHGRKRQVLITHIAARLWGLAIQKIDRIRSALAAAKSEGRPAPTERIRKLQQQVSAHLQECVTLLEGVLESKQAPDMARVRLAHYLRKLKPAAAAKLFERLIADTRDPRTRQAYGLDLAQLWVGQGKPRAALKVLRSAAANARGARAELLRALALQRSGGSGAQLQKLLGRLIRAVATASAPLRRAVIHHLPALLARMEHPARHLQDWSRVDTAGFRAQGSGVAARLVRQLMARGALRAARRVMGAALGAGLSIPAGLRARVHRLAGPWKTRAAPPPPVSWTAQIRARAPALMRCMGSARKGLRSWRLVLLIPPDGSVSEVLSRQVAASPGPPPVVRCVTRVARGWQFPPWRVARAVRLTATLRPTPKP